MKKQKRIVPNVIRGGVAIPLGANYFLMKGKTHEQGGIDIGKDLEVENGELMKIDKNNMTIVSNAPIMNGISPAEYALGGLKDGTFTDRFKEGFKYQEKYKDINGLKDDGTKAKIGKEKTIDEMNSKLLFNIVDDKNSLVNKTYPKNYVERPRTVNVEKDLVAGLHNISEQLKEGWYSYYQNDETNNSKNRFLKDKNTGIIYEDIFNNYDAINLEHFDVVPYSEIKKMLPKRDYIGGDSTNVRIKAFNKIPGIKEKIKELSDTYGIDANLLTHRFLKEGFIDKAISEYNIIPAINQKDYWKNISNKKVDGFDSLGLDDAGTHMLENRYNLRRDIDWWDMDAENEKNRQVKSIVVNNLWDGLEIKAADMEYRQNELRKRGISEEDLPIYVNAAYNLGLYHDDLKNADFIKREYAVPNYYKLGGKLNTRNKYLIGGETIDKSKLTLDEYIQAKADSTRNAAYEKSINRTKGIEIKYPLSEKRRKDNGDYVKTLYIAHPDFVGPVFKSQRYDINNASMYKYIEQEVKELENNCEYGLNCIGTSTDNYPESSRTVVNTDFYNNHSKYGFTKIPFDKVKEGDIVQISEQKELPYHGMIFAGYDEYGQPTFNYSSGGITEMDYKTNAHYPAEMYHAYRYVGTPELIEQWTNEYNQKRLGGKADMKRNKRNVSSTGEKKKAELGLRTDYLDLLIPGGATKAVSKISSKLPDKIISNVETPKLKSVSEAFVEPTNDRKPLTPQQKEELVSGIIEGGAALTSAGMLAATTASNNKMLNNLQRYQDPTKPILSTRQRLKTSVNVNPQLTKSKRILDKTNKFVLNNTGSSQSAYNRIRQNNFDYIDRINDIYSQKENTETGLINQDRTADNENVRYNNGLINQYLNRKDQIGLANTELDNTIAEKKAENKAALYQGISDIVTNMVTNYGKRKQNNKNLRVMAAGFPSITPEYLNEILYR